MKVQMRAGRELDLDREHRCHDAAEPEWPTIPGVTPLAGAELHGDSLCRADRFHLFHQYHPPSRVVLPRTREKQGACQVPGSSADPVAAPHSGRIYVATGRLDVAGGAGS